MAKRKNTKVTPYPLENLHTTNAPLLLNALALAISALSGGDSLTKAQLTALQELRDQIPPF